MLTGVTLASCAVDAQDRYLAALSGVAFLDTATGIEVIAASAGENALTRFSLARISGDNTLTQTDVHRLSAHAGLHDIVATATGTGTGTGTGLTALARWGAAIEIDAAGFSATAQSGLIALSGTASAHLNTAGLMSGTTYIADTAAAPLGDVTALAMLDDGRIIAGSAFDSGIALLDAAGTITDVALAGDGFWHSRVSAIETARIDGRDFAIVAASGSSSLSVFEIGADELILTDHEWDTMMTRFSGVSELATLRIGNMTVVAAGGADQGLSLFELTGEGDLVHLRDIVDTHQTTLNGITGLDMIATETGALLVASSERDNGLSLFELEFEFDDAPAEPAPAIPVHTVLQLEMSPRFSHPSPSDDPDPGGGNWFDMVVLPDMLEF